MPTYHLSRRGGRGARRIAYLGIDPHAYLKDVLERLPSASRRDLSGLLPAAWAGYDHHKKAG